MFTSKIPAIRFTTLELNGVPRGLATSGVDNFEENSDVLTNGGIDGRGIWLDMGVWKVVSSVKEQMQCWRGNLIQAGQHGVSQILYNSIFYLTHLPKVYSLKIQILLLQLNNSRSFTHISFCHTGAASRFSSSLRSASLTLNCLEWT